MSSDETLIQLLTEIRDIQREHLSVYREQARQSMELQEVAIAGQKIAIARQKRAAHVYYAVVTVLAVLAVGWGIYYFLN